MHPASSVLHALQHVISYVATNLSLSNLEATRIFEEKFQNLLGFLSMKLSFLSKCVTRSVKHTFWILVFQSNHFIVQLIYFMVTSFVGFLALKNLQSLGKPVLRDLDLMFTSVSTVTVSSMSTVQMEDLSEQQLWVLILLMLLGGEVFTSILGLHFNNAKANKEELSWRSSHWISRDVESNVSANNRDHVITECGQSEVAISHDQLQKSNSTRRSSRTVLAHIVSGYFLVTVVCSSVVIIIYFWINSDARRTLESKEIKVCTFSIFTAVSSFANCGFTPLNGNMQDFRKNSILLLLVMPQILAGNTLFSPLLWLSVWALEKISGKQEYIHILQHPDETGYKHLHTKRKSLYIVLIVTGLILLQVLFVCSFEWGSKAFEEMNWFQKLVSSAFQSVNTRQAGEAVFDISTFSSPILLMIAIVMYLPSDTSFLPINADRQPLAGKNSSSRTIWKNFAITSPACLALFTFLACITERKSMSADPLNFNVFSITFEVISAFGNVGYSLGYSCDKLLKPDPCCKAASYGFVGRWSKEGKLIIILVMFLGRLKKFILKEENLESAPSVPHQIQRVEATQLPTP
uniref:High-affinity potassium transporter n=1 Tax=Sporobolus virginicus TaxID=751712 RepID=A0A6J4DHS2_9POAL|nr:high-affinity potassium transporter [Sporobolus virginicus]